VLLKSCCQLYDEIHIVGLHLSLVRRLVSYYRSASVAFVDYNVAFLGIRLSLNGTKNAGAIIGSVTGIYIYV
jgi:hypothetical protein